MDDRFKMVSITLRTPGQIKALLEEEGRTGWSVRAVGTSFLFLIREDETALESMIVSITLRSPRAILATIEENASKGWHLGALGSNYLFLHRPAASGDTDPVERSSYEFRMENIILKTPSGILEMANGFGESGWEVKGLGASLLILQRKMLQSKGQNPRPRRNLLENISLKTPGAIQALVRERDADGWSLNGVSRLFMAFSRIEESEESARNP